MIDHVPARTQQFVGSPTIAILPVVIRRSRDGGRTWTTPADAKTGLLADGQFHTAPIPVLVHGGRLWRAVEDASGGKEWGKRYKAMMASVPAAADLLDRGN